MKGAKSDKPGSPCSEKICRYYIGEHDYLYRETLSLVTDLGAEAEKYR